LRKVRGKTQRAEYGSGGGTEVVVLNNCTMIITIPEKNRLSINFTSKPFYINENLDMYEEDEENE